MCDKCKDYDKYYDPELDLHVVPVLVKQKIKYLEIKFCAYCGKQIKGDDKERA